MRLIHLGLIALALPGLAGAGPGLAAQQRQVIVNRTQISDQAVRSYEQRWNIRIQDGSYWYDRMSGAWGLEGGPTAGWIAPGLDLGGPLRADASGGNTGVFINGRELHLIDVQALMQIVQVQRGRWWVDARGNFGPEGGPVWGNLVLLAQQRGKAGGNWSTYSSDGHSFIGGDGNCTYFNSHDAGTSTDYSYASPGC
jgi:hypothetical protein